jgi:3-methyladenine DNA glycosylase/8-oxoguanine DNA glycosylase
MRHPTRTVPTPRHFAFAQAIEFLAPRAVPSLETVSATAYRRSLRLDGRPITVEVAQPADDRHGSQLVIRSTPAFSPTSARAFAREQFDLDADLDRFRRQVAGDRTLGPLVRASREVRLVRYLDPFEGTVRAILGQQVSIAAARTMTDRVVRLDPVSAPRLDTGTDDDRLMFPTPAQIVALGRTALRGVGLTNAKTDALIAVSDAVLSGVLDWTWLGEAPPDHAQARLESVRGIGPWTATYVRMRVLGDRDAFPASDLGVIKALQAASRSGVRPTVGEIVERAEPWRPWRADAPRLLWRSLAKTPSTRKPGSRPPVRR